MVLILVYTSSNALSPPKVGPVSDAPLVKKSVDLRRVHTYVINYSYRNAYTLLIVYLGRRMAGSYC